MKNYFYIDESVIEGKYLIKPDADKCHILVTRGSLQVLEARIFGLNYIDYIRMCRDVYGATLKGKNSLYISVYFSSYEAAVPLLNELNRRAEIIFNIWEHNNVFNA